MTTNGEKIVEKRWDMMSNLWQPGQERTTRHVHFLEPSFPNKMPLPNLPSHSQSSSTNPLIINCNGWQKPYRAWDEWVLQMEPRYGSMWKSLGIFNAIKNSTIQICPQKNVMMALARKWSPETNTFVFKWGEATVTLEDVFVLGGFSATGASVSVPVTNDMFVTEEKLLAARKVINNTTSKKCTFNVWIKHFTDETNGFDDVKHEAFLVFWLSKFVFPKVKDTVGKHVHSVAIRLAKGVRIALGPAVLASIYRDLTTLASTISKPFTNNNSSGRETIQLWSLMHLVQAWAWERFPTLGPNPNSIRDGETRLARWHDLKGVEMDDVGRKMDASKEDFKWRPFCVVVQNWNFNEFYWENGEWVEVEIINNGSEAEQFAMFIRHSELVGLDGFMEPYLPHRVAMQFGMSQEVPDNIPRVDGNVESAWVHYKRPFGGEKVYIPSRLLQGDVTIRYTLWWNPSRSLLPADEDGDDKLSIKELTKKYKKVIGGRKIG